MNRSVFHSQLFQLILAYFKEMIREPGVLFWGIAFPILMSLGLGVAFTKKTDVIRKVAIVANDEDASGFPDTTLKLEDFLRMQGVKEESRDDDNAAYSLIIPDDKMGNTTLLFYKATWQEAMIMLKRGNISLVMSGENRLIRYHFDPVNTDAQLTYLKLSKVLRGEAISMDQSEETIEPLTVSGTRYIDFLVPGLIAMGVMMSCMWGLSYGMIDKRSKKLLRRMLATPMKKSYFLIALITVRIVMNFIESSLLLLFAWLVFDIHIQGNITALLLIFIAGNIAFAGIAVFISSHTSNTEIGNGLINAIVMPMMVLSGVFFSYHNFPEWSIGVIQKLPLTLLADGVRSIFIEGAGFREILLPFFILMATGLVFFATGLKIFKWH
jgi:ABC-type multidrug transport system permease subunit